MLFKHLLDVIPFDQEITLYNTDTNTYIMEHLYKVESSSFLEVYHYHEVTSIIALADDLLEIGLRAN